MSTFAANMERHTLFPLVTSPKNQSPHTVATWDRRVGLQTAAQVEVYDSVYGSIAMIYAYAPDLDRLAVLQFDPNGALVLRWADPGSSVADSVVVFENPDARDMLVRMGFFGSGNILVFVSSKRVFVVRAGPDVQPHVAAEYSLSTGYHKGAAFDAKSSRIYTSLGHGVHVYRLVVDSARVQIILERALPNELNLGDQAAILPGGTLLVAWQKGGTGLFYDTDTLTLLATTRIRHGSGLVFTAMLDSGVFVSNIEQSTGAGQLAVYSASGPHAPVPFVDQKNEHRTYLTNVFVAGPDALGLVVYTRDGHELRSYRAPPPMPAPGPKHFGVPPLHPAMSRFGELRRNYAMAGVLAVAKTTGTAALPGWMLPDLWMLTLVAVLRANWGALSDWLLMLSVMNTFEGVTPQPPPIR